MAIKRARRRTSFSAIDNEAFTSGLSLRAIGLLTYLLSKPDDWTVSVAHLTKVFSDTARPDGRDSIYATLQELIDMRFVTRSERRSSGRMDGTDYEVYDQKQAPLPASPLPAQPYTAEPTLLKTDSDQRLIDSKDSVSLRSTVRSHIQADSPDLFQAQDPNSGADQNQSQPEAENPPTAQPPAPPPDPRPRRAPNPDDPMSVFWSLVADLEPRGVKRSICGAIAKLNPDPAALIRMMRQASGSRNPASYLCKVRANLQAEQRARQPGARPMDREPHPLPPWVDQRRNQWGGTITWLGPDRWRDDYGDIRNDAYEIIALKGQGDVG